MKRIHKCGIILLLAITVCTNYGQPTALNNNGTAQAQPETKEPVSWTSRLWQKIVCLNLLNAYCASERHLFYVHSICFDCMRCLHDANDCTIFKGT